jgi:hypothetical protein
MPTDAIALVVEHGDAVHYYRQVPEEPTPSGSVSVTEATFVKHASVSELLKIVGRKRPRNLLVESHASGSGIGLTLVPKTQHALVSPYLGDLVNSAGKVSEDLAAKLEISMSDLRVLQNAAQKVRALRLARVDFRSCMLGDHQDTLELLRTFFGAGAVSAPKAFDKFSHVSPGTPTRARPR